VSGLGSFVEGRMSHRLRFGSRVVPLPRSRLLRVVLGAALVIGGMLGFLPVLGFWMIPLGLLVLSVDFAVVRRLRRRLEVRWTRWRRSRSSGE